MKMTFIKTENEPTKPGAKSKKVKEIMFRKKINIA